MKVAPAPADPLIGELVSLIKELTTAQNRVLEQAMGAQQTNADMLKTWMSMFAPQKPTPSTNEDDRARLREEREAASDWTAIEDFPGFDNLFPKDH